MQDLVGPIQYRRRLTWKGWKQVVKIHIAIDVKLGDAQSQSVFDWEGDTPIDQVFARLDRWFDLISSSGNTDVQHQIDAVVAQLAEHRKPLAAAPRP